MAAPQDCSNKLLALVETLIKQCSETEKEWDSSNTSSRVRDKARDGNSSDEDEDEDKDNDNDNDNDKDDKSGQRGLRKLLLDGTTIGTMTEEIGLRIQEIKTLEGISMNACKLKSILGLKECPNVTELELSDNFLTGEMDIIADRFPKLTRLLMVANRIPSVETLRPLTKCKMLTDIAVEKNPLEAEDGSHRAKIFELLPTVQVIDWVDREGKAVSEPESAEEQTESDEESEDGEQDDVSKGPDDERKSRLSEIYSKDYKQSGSEEGGSWDESDSGSSSQDEATTPNRPKASDPTVAESDDSSGESAYEDEPPRKKRKGGA